MAEQFFTDDGQMNFDGNFESFNDQNQVDENGAAEQQVDCEQDEDRRKLFVGGLTWQTTEAEVEQYFSRFGEIVSCSLKMDRITGNSRGFGFVVFADESTIAAINACNVHKINGKKIDARLAKPPREPQRKVFVGGFDPDVGEEDIKTYFGKFGKIESLDLPYDTMKGKRKPFIFVTYATETDAMKAVARSKQDINGRSCDVKLAVPMEEDKRMKAEAAAWGGGGYGADAGAYGGGGYGGGYEGYGGAAAGGMGGDYASYRPPPYAQGGASAASGYGGGYGSRFPSRGGPPSGGGKMMRPRGAAAGGRGGAPGGGAFGGGRGGAPGAFGGRGGAPARGGGGPFRPYPRRAPRQ